MNQKSEPTNSYRFQILRYDASKNSAPRFQEYELTPDRDMSVLEALLRLQDEQDPSLAFRYSCRGAICGSCAMSINGKLDLACRTQLKNLGTKQVVVEPLPNLDVLKDLVVDMGPFWDKYERIRPWLHAEAAQAKESGMTEKARDRIDQYVNCILCALCYGACPVIKSNEDFTGPAALAKFYRFLADSRSKKDAEVLDAENKREGAWGCHTIRRCIEACPKQVRPTDGISGVRREMIVHKIRRAVGLGA